MRVVNREMGDLPDRPGSDGQFEEWLSDGERHGGKRPWRADEPPAVERPRWQTVDLVGVALALALVAALVALVLSAGSEDDPELTRSPHPLPVAEEHTSGYEREAFGGYDREQVIELGQRRFPQCDGHFSRYDDACHASAGAVHADHTVPLAEAWHSGAWRWGQSRRDQFAADLDNLAVMTARLNVTKGDDDPAEWLPEHRVCEYVEQWVSVKAKYGLSADQAERDALADAAQDCGSLR